MPTGSGRTKDKTEIITTYGCRTAFKNNLIPGTKIWIYYNDFMEIISIEPRSNRYSPENNPNIQYEEDVGNGE